MLMGWFLLKKHSRHHLIMDHADNIIGCRGNFTLDLIKCLGIYRIVAAILDSFTGKRYGALLYHTQLLGLLVSV